MLSNAQPFDCHLRFSLTLQWTETGAPDFVSNHSRGKRCLTRWCSVTFGELAWNWNALFALGGL